MQTGVNVTLDNGFQAFIPCVPGKTSDGFHTFDELYDHRHALLGLLLKMQAARSWKSRLHHDGSSFPGYFIAGMHLPIELPDRLVNITYHLPDHYWDLLEGVPELAVAPEWDGHTSADVLERLTTWLKQIQVLYTIEYELP